MTAASFEQVMEAAKQAENILTWKNWMNLVAYALNCGVTYISMSGIFGETNTELSKKYQTLITPAGWAFSIWGIIFIGEGVFAVAQMLSQFRSRPSVEALAPWWWSACGFQVVWTLFFAQDMITMAFLCMLVILVSLLGLLWVVDAKRGPVSEYWLIRAPFSFHAGWIIAASALNLSVEADAHMASQTTLLTLAIASFALVFTAASLAAVAIPVPNPIISFVAFWALLAMHSELGEAKLLKDPTRFNYSAWPQVVLESVRGAALCLSLASLAWMFVAIALRLRPKTGEAEEARKIKSFQGVSVPMGQV